MAGVKVVTTKVKSKAITKFPCIGMTGEGSTELIVLFESLYKGTVL